MHRSKSFLVFHSLDVLWLCYAIPCLLYAYRSRGPSQHTATILDSWCFPNSKSFGYSAIIKLSGQNCFQTLYGSLGQIRLGLPKGSAIAMVKVLGQNDTYVFWVFSLNGFRLPKGFLECSPNCPAHSSQQSLPQFLGKWLLLQKRFCGGFPQPFSTSLVSQIAVASQKNLWRVPPTASHLSRSLLLGAKLRELLTCLNHTNRVHRKRPIMSLLLGYSLGLFHHLIRINSQNSHNSSVASIQKRGTLLIRLETGVSNSRSSSSGTSGR